MLPLLRVIDKYLINFKKVDGKLLCSSLESSMRHKRTRVHEFVNQQAAASNESGAIETLLTQTKKKSKSFYKDQVAKFAMTLLQKRPFNANAADELTDAEQLPLFNLFSQVVDNSDGVSEARRKIQEKIIWLLLA